VDILDDMGVSKLSAKVFFKSELLVSFKWLFLCVCFMILYVISQ